MTTLPITEFNAMRHVAFTKAYSTAEKKNKPLPKLDDYIFTDRNFGYVTYDNYIAVWARTIKQSEFQFIHDVKRMKI